MPPITFVAAGGFAYDNNLSPLAALSYPATVERWDLLLMIVGQKPSVANGGSVPTPSGWTAVGQVTGAGGYGTTLAADVGNTNLFVFSKIADGTEGGTSLSVAHVDTDALWARILGFRSSTWNFEPVGFSSGSDESAGNVSIAFGSDPGVVGGDYVVGAMCIPTDVTTPSQFTAHGLTQPGVTFGSVTEIGEADTIQGFDLGGYIVRAPVFSGSSTGVPTMTATASGTTTNVRGPGVFLRLREILADMLVAHDLTAGPYVVGGTIVGQPLLAGNLMLGAAEVEAAAFDSFAGSALFGPGVEVGCPVIGHAAIGQRHELVSPGVSLGVLSVGSAWFALAHALVAADIIPAGVAILGASSVAEVSQLDARVVHSGAPVVGSPAFYGGEFLPCPRVQLEGRFAEAARDSVCVDRCFDGVCVVPVRPAALNCNVMVAAHIVAPVGMDFSDVARLGLRAGAWSVLLQSRSVDVFSRTVVIGANVDAE